MPRLKKAEIENTPWGFWVHDLGKVVAGVIRSDFRSTGASFITPDAYSLQVALMERPQGHRIPSHYHLPVPRDLIGTQEVLLIQKGKLRADLFNEQQDYLGSVNLTPGDLILLISGGHGFVASEDCRFFEVKQGPFVEGADKKVFDNAVGESVTIRLLE